MATTSKALTALNLNKSPREAVASLREILETMTPDFGKIMRQMPVEMMVQDIINAVSKNPQLQKCTTLSLMRCAMMAVQLELRPETPQQLAHFVPFKNHGVLEAQFMPGYRGLIKKALENPKMASIEARCVFVGEDFDLDYGAPEPLRHKPDLTGEADKLGDNLKDNLEKFVGCYARVRMAPDLNGVEPPALIEWMSKSAILGIKNDKVKAKDGPWFDARDFFQQARKTVIKRLCNYLPSGPSMMLAVDLDHAASMGEPQPFTPPKGINTEVFDEFAGEEESETAKSDKVADDLKKQASKTKSGDKTKPKPEKEKPKTESPPPPSDPEPPTQETPEDPPPPPPDDPDQKPFEQEKPTEPEKPTKPAPRTRANDMSREGLEEKLSNLLTDNDVLLGPELVAQYQTERIKKWNDKALADTITYMEGLILKRKKEDGA